MSKIEKISTHAVIYARFSSKMQNDGASIDLQLDACKDFASKNGYTIVGTYVDEAISGTKEDQRIQFMQMIADAETLDFSTVLVYKYNRFARDMRLQSKYEDLLDQSEVSLIATTENYGDSHQASLLKMISAWSAENDILQISENVLRGQKSRARECRHCGGAPPLGYQVDPVTKHLVLSDDPLEIQAVQTIFEMRAMGYTFEEISRTLDKKGINCSRKGHRIPKTSMLSILKNEKYKGVFLFNKSIAKDKHGKRNGHQYKDDSEIIRVPNGCPTIIDDVLFDQVQTILKNPASMAGGRARAKRHYLLSGFLKCQCGASYIAHYRNERPGHRAYSSYVCSGRRRIPDTTCQNPGIEMTSLEKAVLSLVQDFLLQDATKITEQMNAHHRSLYEGLESELLSNRSLLIEVQKKIRNISEAIADGLYDVALRQKLEELKSSEQLLNEQMMGLKKATNTKPVTVEIVQKKLFELNADMKSHHYREVQMVLSSIIDQIVIYDDYIEVTLTVAFLNDLENFMPYLTTHTISRESLKNSQYNGSYSPDSASDNDFFALFFSQGKGASLGLNRKI
ncbi:MAG: recombinase family protein [Acetobacterium sp.]